MFVVLAISVLVLCVFQASCDISEYSCSNTSYCQDQLGNSHCSSQKRCVCDSYSYLQTDPLPFCQGCPEVQESCEESHCCAEGLVCYQGIDVCIYIDQTWSVSESERLRFQRVAQCVLGVALILTAIILFILFWKACSRPNTMVASMRTNSFPTLNSIQRLVLMQLQDRPPPYSDEYMRSNTWKRPSDAELPPSYIEALSAMGHDNQVFILEESSMSGSGGPYGCLQAYVITPQQQQSGSNNTLPPPPYCSPLSENRQVEVTSGNTVPTSQNDNNHCVLDESNVTVNLRNSENANEIHI